MASSDTPANPPLPAASGPDDRIAAAAGGAASEAVKVTAGTAPYVTRPTPATLYLRTFLPWQVWRFARINLKMLRIIQRSRT